MMATWPLLAKRAGAVWERTPIVFGKTPSETALITLTRGNDIEPGKEFYTAVPTTNTITIDGNLTEWTGAPVLADPKFYVKRGAEGTGPVKDPRG
jgi:hypothetical protein